MKFSAAVLTSVLFALSASAAPAASIETRDLTGDVTNFFNSIGGFGVQANVDNQGGSCTSPFAPAGARIPCSCPPDQGAFISTVVNNVNAGHVISGNGAGTPLSFPGDSTDRLFAFRDTLQGMLCPIVSTAWADLLPH
ncbi:hypothetical protein HMN09_00469400 [Mycena chlorophos]|uniref:Uncharacterized protein n=1 Tax=Mycena chlorophos TaxID=658473 RepID=A0A8H6TIJ6_MYCCL|nr:hypothetical protein HMN09_00469400 [Mycena chlorophos]